ncbi:MAG: glycosyltransferase [Opitutaceae bacterium]|jgi:glycosyltransferase involved in cell wall biosynthesis
MSLRILHVIGSVNPAAGGTIEGVKQLSKVNTAYGHTVEVASLDDPASPWVDKLGLPVHAMGPSYTHYGYCPRLVPWLRANRKNYDAVIVDGIWGYNALGVWRALHGTDTAYYVYTHGMLDPWFKYRYPLKHLKKWLFWPWAVFPVLSDARGVFFTCEEERRLARNSFWLYDCNEIVMTHGTPGVPDTAKDYGAAFLEKRPELKSFRRFVFLGRVHPKKGPDIIIRTITGLQAAGRWDPAVMRLVLAGPADGDYAARLQALAKKLGVDGSIVWTGMLLGDDKWGALQSAEVFLLPSHQENFGIAVAESLSVGVPVLISKAVNIWADIVADGAGTAGEDTVPDFERQMTDWLEMSEEEVAIMRQRARLCFENRYTSRRAAVAMLANIYQIMAVEKLGAAERHGGRWAGRPEGRKA